VGFLALSDRDREKAQKESASSSELGLYLIEGPGDKTTGFHVVEWR
jgi:hypothetical protein